MRSVEFISELVAPANHLIHAINRINVVANICEKMGNKPLMYREHIHEDHPDQIYSGSELNLISKVSPEPGRIYNDQDKLLQPYVLSKLGIKNPVWATLQSWGGTRGPFGENNFMVPIGRYKVHYSPVITDLGSDDRFYDLNGNEKKQIKNFDMVVRSYKTGMPAASHGKKEVILDCDSYYLINVGEFVGKYAGEKAQSILLKHRLKDVILNNQEKWNDLNADLLHKQFETYTNIAWHLKNPVTNYFKWIQQNTTASSGATDSGNFAAVSNTKQELARTQEKSSTTASQYN